MATKQQEKLAEKLARKSTAAAKKKDIQDATDQGKGPEMRSRPKRQRTEPTPTQESPVPTSPEIHNNEEGEKEDVGDGQEAEEGKEPHTTTADADATSNPIDAGA
ncbi:putative hypoxia up-regulated protein [Sesbania bispinosa]|nr:putative hypoxia up-regulated protein [Sesbania bispinosa]